MPVYCSTAELTAVYRLGYSDLSAGLSKDTGKFVVSWRKSSMYFARKVLDGLFAYYGAIISDEPVGQQTFDEYGLRFDIEEGCLDFKSAGFQLESSQLEDSDSLSRLLLILATATLYLVSTGTAVVEMGRRHWVDPHWFRGLSYLQIGWRGAKRALAWGQKLLSFLWLTSKPDPEPAMASWRNRLEPDLRLSCIEWYDFVKVQ